MGWGEQAGPTPDQIRFSGAGWGEIRGPVNDSPVPGELDDAHGIGSVADETQPVSTEAGTVPDITGGIDMAVRRNRKPEDPMFRVDL